MSGLGGVWAPAGGRVNPVSLTRLAQALAPRGAHRTTLLLEPGVAFVLASLREPDSRRPEWWRRDGVWLAWDGRLDNRSEIDGALGLAAGHDLHRLALAYERWGLGFLERIEGDFALALWDGRARRLLLARDSMGVRPLFYAKAGEGWVWGSTLQAVRAAGNVPGDLDEGWVAGYFAHAIEPGVTPFRAVRAVAPGHAVVLENGALRERAFWAPGVRPRPDLPDDRAYEERFAELFVDAVRCRLPEHSPVAAELSGGLDSSSIVCVADRLIRDGRVSTTELLTLSWIYPQSPSSDERRFIRLVEEHIDSTGRHLSESDGPAFVGLEAPEYDYPTIMECLKGRQGTGSQAMWALGARVLLSGFAGDHVVHGEFGAALPLADYVRSGRWRAFARSLRSWHERQGEPYLGLVGGSLALAFLPVWLRRRTARSQRSNLACLDEAFARRTRMRERLVELAVPGGPGAPGKRQQLAAIRAAIQTVSWLYDTGGWPYQTAYPFLHRPLVEFCLSVPSEQFMRPGETRSLHRRALRGFLPPAIAARRDKRGPDEALLRELAMGWERVRPLLEDAEVVRRGFVDAVALRHQLDQARFGYLGANLPYLMKTIALEAWLRAVPTNDVERQRSKVENGGKGTPSTFDFRPSTAVGGSVTD